MVATTEQLNLYQPSLDDDIDVTIKLLSDNFKIIDDNFDQSIDNLNSILQIGRMYPVGKKIWNNAPSIDGYAGWINIRSGVFAPNWKAQTTYKVGDKVAHPSDNGHYYECISNGTSALTVPSLPTTEGGTAHDLFGHTVWEPSYSYSKDDIVVSTSGDKSYFYKCIVAGTSGSTEPAWKNISGTTIIDGSVQWYAYKTVAWREKGVSCEFTPFGLVGGKSITSVGIVTKGKWNADTISIEYGGTGASNAKDARGKLNATGKFAMTIGDGTKRSFTINHNLSTKDVVVSVRETGVQSNFVNASIKAPDEDNVIVEFPDPPSTNQYRVIVIG